MSHEIMVTCPVCGEEYDAHLHWTKCPVCGFDSEKLSLQRQRQLPPLHRQNDGVMRIIDEIIIHCSATEAGKDFKAADIDRWHKAKGWKGIGYHFVIDIDGSVETGRPVEEIGAHTANHNATTIGICYIGGLRYGKAADTRTDAQKKSLRELVAVLRSCFPAIHMVSGHNQYAKKACPCFDVSKEYQ